MHKDKEFKLHFYEQISQQQTIITNELARALTQLNLKRIESSSNNMPNHPPLSNRQDYLYVCITGLPTMPNQYQGLQIPGQKILVYAQCYSPGTTEQQSLKQIQSATLENQAALLHNRLKDRTDKPLVFIFHSFGTAIASTLFRLYYHHYVNRVIGIIAIGCYPIRPNLILSNFVALAESMSRQEMFKNVDKLYNQVIDMFKQFSQIPPPNKYALIGELVAFGHGLGFNQMFSYIRRWFPVLKCFIYGRKDSLINEENLNQTVAYYCYKRPLDKNYSSKICSILSQKYGLKVDNPQQRFIYNIKGGKHSIHEQPRFQGLINKIIDQYLTVIERTTPFQKQQ